MTRFLAAAALSVGLAATMTPSASACEFSQCAWGKIVCSVVHCPIICANVPTADRTVCIAR
ncbi:MAG TPA: hypothetical protein VF519_12975 [Mycobacteriales bacterium]|jgi:hypothetical protein